nr:hypothetical protein [Fredinandcohnia onubensis]
MNIAKVGHLFDVTTVDDIDEKLSQLQQAEVDNVTSNEQIDHITDILALKKSW